MNVLNFSGRSSKNLMTELETSENGLSMSEVLSRQKKYGLNEIGGRETHWWDILGRQFKSPFIYLLIGAAALSIAMRETIDGIMVICFIVINSGLGFIQEFHSEKSVKLLKKFVIARTRVRRDGHEYLAGSKDLTLGDVIIVGTGDVLPADVRFFEANDLMVDESILTGESAPAEKSAGDLAQAAADIYAAKNMGFSGTCIASGRGMGVVVAIGQDTIIGDAAKMTTETQRVSPFEKGINNFSKIILRMVVVIIMFIFAANVLIKGHGTDIAELVLFSIALAVSVIPEALPVVTTLSLSRGALRLAREQVVVKRLSAVEDLGSIEVLCTDKTGTITENKLQVAGTYGQADRAIYLAALASSFLGEKKREPNNAFDLALWNKISADKKQEITIIKRVSELPFDPDRRRNSVLVEKGQERQMIVRGAFESIAPLCADLDEIKHAELGKWIKAEGMQGRRTIILAERACPSMINYKEKDEQMLSFVGAISFEDPIKATTKSAIQQAAMLGVMVKIITGDSPEVAGAVAARIGLIQSAEAVLTGERLEKMNDEEQLEAVEKYSVFARVSPRQKFLIIQTLQRKFEVGFLGEGINDAPALKLANVALAVDGASDIAREASDIILLNPSLAVIIDGIRSGREIFANTVKYLKITLISNFGNFYAIAVASLIISFLPMLPAQLLLLNLLSDFPMIAIAMDTVDKNELKRPRSYNVREVVLMAVLLGLVSTVFDFIFFGLYFRKDPSVLQTNWFIGSVLTELVLIYSIRTRGLFIKARRPSTILSALSIVAIGATLLLPFTPLGIGLFKFTPPTAYFLITIFSVVICYFIITEILKRVYYRFAGNGDGGK
ncbi:MAG: HAD-IC family P-type ATPase [Patescibacteria group bacterium]